MKTYTVYVQSLNEQDSYLIDADDLMEAILEAILSFSRTHTERASSVQAESVSVSTTE